MAFNVKIILRVFERTKKLCHNARKVAYLEGRSSKTRQGRQISPRAAKKPPGTKATLSGYSDSYSFMQLHCYTDIFPHPNPGSYRDAGLE
jgi:hypothetical protein